jgi:aspartate racemase
MKTIGLIGGMSWESSAEYYRLINRCVRDQHGSNANAKSLMLTVNFAEIAVWQHQQDWSRLAEEMARAALQLQAGGADCVLLCTNTMHKVANEIQVAISIPLLHIAEVTSSAIHAQGVTTI